MSLQLGGRVRVTRGDMRGRVGVIHRLPQTTITGSRAYGVAFPGELPLSSFRASNLEAVGTQALIPEFLEMSHVVHRLVGDEPYEVITGGWMGKRRRYWWTEAGKTRSITAAHGDAEVYDFRRFPIEHNGIVVSGLWSRFQPRPEGVAHVLSLVAIPGEP